jgi:O-antigen ligase/tetratricopeptide (TPR) repeat protein
LSRRRKRQEPAAQDSPAVSKQVFSLPLLLTAAALALAVLGGGMIYDRVDPQPGFTNLADLIGTPVSCIFAAVALCFAVWQKGERSGGRPWAPFAFGAFLSWCALSALLAENPFAAFSMLAVTAGAIAAGAAVRYLAAGREAAVAFAIAMAGAADYVAALGVREYLVRWREGNALWRVFGGFVNPDFLAGYLLVALPVTAGLFLMAQRPTAKMLGALSLLLQTACLVLTGSRLGLAALFVEVIVFAVLFVRSGGLTATNRVTTIVAASVVALTLAGAGGPMLRRVLSSGSEAHSARFRLLTWRGTARMAAAKPLAGAGIGTFETSYPAYQEVGYTQHAHSGFLQFAGETGLPGVILLIAGLAGTAVYGVRLLKRIEGRENDVDRAPVLLIAGCVSGIAGSAAHNLFDSDFYVPATAFTLAGVVGLVLAQRTAVTVQNRSPHEAVRSASRMGAALLLVWLLVTEGRTAAARIAANGAAADYQELRALAANGTGDQESLRKLLDGAIEGYKSARGLQPGNPEFALKLANLYEASGQRSEAEAVYRQTAEQSRLGKAHYRYGRFLSSDRPGEAYDEFVKARGREPKNLQTLLRLAEAASAVGKTAEAEEVYRYMIRLYRSEFGAVRPLPELVDWEFGTAYVGLAQIQLARGEKASAEKSLRDGTGILGEFWRTRHLEIATIRIGKEVRQETSARYESGLTQLASLYEESGRKAEADEARDRLAALRSEREEDKTREP